MPCTGMHAVSVIVGPTRAHWAQNDGTRAARAARGAALRGRPSHVAAAAVRRRAFQMCVHAATFNAGHASATTGGLHGTVDPRSCQNVDADIQAGTGEPHGPRVVAFCPPCMGVFGRHTYNSPRDNRAVARVQQLLRPRDWAGPAGPPPLAARAARVPSF